MGRDGADGYTLGVRALTVLCVAVAVAIPAAAIWFTGDPVDDRAPSAGSDSQSPNESSSAPETPSSSPYGARGPFVSPSPSASASPSTPPSRGPGTQALVATYTTLSDWGSGFFAQVQVTNRGPASIRGWTVVLRLTAGVRVGASSGARAEQSGTVVTFTAAPWNRSLRAGETRVFGFEATAPGPFPGPMSCSVNGQPCQP